MKFISTCAAVGLILLSGLLPVLADSSGAVAPSATSGLPDPGSALIRVIGALALVIGLFLGGVWVVRNWQRVGGKRGQAAKLSVLETRSLGNRHAIHVVGYERERFLVASSPGSVNLLSHLAAATDETAGGAPGTSAAPSFAQALTQVLKGK